MKDDFNIMQIENQIGVSVIICCYNSGTRLPETLHHLAKQLVPNAIPWEVIVVDNASNDDTAKVAQGEWKKYGLSVPFLVVHEPKPGLSYARDKGFETARYEYCVFCDDDNWLSENYVKVAYDTMKSDKTIGALGGQGIEVCEIKPPKWFDELKGGYAVGKQGSKSGDVTKDRGYVFGAGIVFRKSAIIKLKKNGFESLLTGRKKKQMYASEDKELCYGLIIAGYKISYEEALTFKHFIPKERLTETYVKNLYNGFAKSQPILTLYEYVLKNRHLNTLKHLWFKDLMYSIYYYIKRRRFQHTLTKEMGYHRIKELVKLCWSYNRIYKHIENLKCTGTYH